MATFNFDPFQSLRAMGLLQLKGMHVFFSGGGDRRRGGRPDEARGSSKGINVIFVLFGAFAKFGWRSCYCILFRTSLYLYFQLYVF